MPFQNRLSSAMLNHKLDGSLPANPANDRRKANAVTLKSSGVARGGAARPGCHHFGVTPFCNTSQTEKKTTICLISLEMLSRGGVEDTRLEAKAKDSLSEDRTSRGQGQECSRPRPRTKDTGTSRPAAQKVYLPQRRRKV